MRRSVEGKTVTPPEPAEQPRLEPGDRRRRCPRSSRPHALAPRASPRAGGRRVVSVISLVALDLVGLTLGLYVALVVRDLWYRTERRRSWARSAAPRATGCRSSRWSWSWSSPRPASIAIVRSASAWGACSRRSSSSPCWRLRSASASATTSRPSGSRPPPCHDDGVRRPTARLVRDRLRGAAPPSGRPPACRPRRLCGRGRVAPGSSAASAAASSTTSSAWSARTSTSRTGSAGTPTWPRSSPVTSTQVIVAGDVRDAQLLEIVEVAHRAGVQVRVAPSITELRIQRAEYVPGQGTPLFESACPRSPAATGW